jgi:hypothetical protein
MKWAFLMPPNLVGETFIGSDKSATVFGVIPDGLQSSLSPLFVPVNSSGGG